MQRKKWIVLLGDSIFDNKRYVGMGDSVIEQLQAYIDNNPDSGIEGASLLAIDGSTIKGIPWQTSNVVRYSLNDDRYDYYYFISTGGNDGLQYLNEHGQSIYSLITKIPSFLNELSERYEDMICTFMNIENVRNVCICNIYSTNFSPFALRYFAKVGVYCINYITRRASKKFGIPVIDLWSMFDPKKDLANPIEPGVTGGAKIVKAIVNHVQQN